MDKNKVTFEEVFKQNENRIHYHIQKLGIRDSNREFYTGGLYAMWMAYKKYDPNKGPLSTYFNYTIRNHLIDMLRKETIIHENNKKLKQEVITKRYKGNHNSNTNLPIMNPSGMHIKGQDEWKPLFSLLTQKQRKWVNYHIILGLSIKEIAERESVTVEAVKGWGKEARRKLRTWAKDNENMLK
ncbi:sigma-70 family RNA polymerase sigma factor [Oceanobacillus piezotolerans]|uniref:Sigma-70 family RNA polymerase sigma factor n=1 Tax=Oceanobacillus piezotolerans TaxID=2448030 RepID=A0A498D4Z3_9BACI|nr:sigma-70 family RNA polymerase sigma factor [Oceanobacillus piezotolerans]RLL43916.1 sigma-70 family RNA polymerase sigma factor [Oceanobacillus piezotolerans]